MTDRVLALIPRLLSENGIFYLVIIKENNQGNFSCILLIKVYLFYLHYNFLCLPECMKVIRINYVHLFVWLNFR